MSKRVVIIGGGIIGLSSAYYLHRDGHDVTVIDKSDFSGGASFVNAGYITPSHIIPLSAPGMITKGIKWMFNPESPFYVKPRLDLDFLKWAWAFKKSATQNNVKKAIPVIKDINILSRELYQSLKDTKAFDFHFDHKGLLMFYQTDKAGEEEWGVAQEAMKLGLKVENLSKDEVTKIEPNAALNIKGAVYFHSDAHMTPNHFMPKFKEYLTYQGVNIISKEEVTDVEVSKKKITAIKTAQKTFHADEFVLAAGAWAQNFGKKLGLNIPIQAGKGYRVNVKSDTKISMPAILIESKVAVTPMNGFTRFAGTMEIAGINHNINSVRVQAIAKAGQSYYPDIQITQEEISNAACGLRPCSPDGLPYIGKSKKICNLTVATGHAMMGWSLGPATGKLVSEIIGEKKTSLNLSPFHPDRKF